MAPPWGGKALLLLLSAGVCLIWISRVNSCNEPFTPSVISDVGLKGDGGCSCPECPKEDERVDKKCPECPSKKCPRCPTHVAKAGNPSEKASASAPVDWDSEFAIFCTTAFRKNNAFYVPRLTLNLENKGMPARSILLFNVEPPGSHPMLEKWAASSEYEKYPVKIIQRDTPFMTREEYIDLDTRDKNAQTRGMQDFQFSVHDSFLEATSQYQQSMTDDASRRYWRSKEVVDFLYAARQALYYYRGAEWLIFLEDDMEFVQHKGSALAEFKKAIDQRNGISWLVGIYQGTSKAVLFHRQLLESFIGFAAIRYTAMPIDWLLEQFVEYHLGIKPMGHKSHILAKMKFVPLFRHIGKTRSIP